jgi:hypothetical protein
MKTQDFMNTVYDILAQNEVDADDRQQVWDRLDHVDLQRNSIVFLNDDGLEFELKLIEIFAPAPYKGGTL